jgi:WD40 repeat protein
VTAVDTAPDAAALGGPYVGLTFYTQENATLFFGRDTERTVLISNLHAARLTLLYAQSGTGKSSLLRAGVAARLGELARRSLRQQGTPRNIPVVFSSWRDDPTVNLIDEIQEAVIPFMSGALPLEFPNERLDLAIEAASGAADARLLVMLDQFEEYLLYRSGEARDERFADELAACINRPNLHANFLIAVREDAYSGLGDLFKGRIANVYGNYLHLEHLDRDSARMAIEQPIARFNQLHSQEPPVQIEPELVDTVLGQLRPDQFAAEQGGVGGLGGGQGAGHGGDGIAAPYLQLVMTRLWESELSGGSLTLRLATLEELGGAKEIVRSHVDRALGGLAENDRGATADILRHLVTPSGTKIALAASDLAEYTDRSVGETRNLLERLAGSDTRILRPVPPSPGGDGEPRFEISHDLLAPTILDWGRRQRADRLEEEKKAAQQQAQAEKSRARRFRALAIGSAALLALALCSLVFMILAINSAAHEKLIAESRELAAEANASATQDPELAVLLALKALQRHYTSQAEDSLRAALPGLQAARTLQEPTTALSAAFDPDPTAANKVASAADNGIASMWDVTTGRRLFKMSLGGFGATGGAGPAVFNPAGTEVAVGYADGQVAVFDARSGRKLHSAKAGSYVNDVVFLGSSGKLAIVTPNGLAVWASEHESRCCQVLSRNRAVNLVAANPRNPQELAVTTATGVVIWNLSSGKHQRLPQGPWSVNDAEFSPNGREIVTADSDGRVRVYDLPALTNVMTLYAGDLDATSAAFSPGISQIVVGYSSGMARVWDTLTRLQVTQLAGSRAYVGTARFSPSGGEVVTANADSAVRVWYARPRELKAEFASSQSSGRPNAVGGAAYLPDGRIVTLDTSGQLRVFTTSGTPQAYLKPRGATVDEADWNTAGTDLVTADSDETVVMWHAVGSNYAIRHHSSIHVRGGIGQIAMSPGGSTITVVPANNSYAIQVRSAHTGRTLRTLNANNSLRVLAFSPSGSQLVAGDVRGQVEVWSKAAGHPRLLGKPGPYISDLKFNQTGSEFTTVSASGTVTVWVTLNDRPRRTIPAACPSVNTASPSPNGSEVVVACGDGTARVFDVATGRQLTVLPATTTGIVSWAGFSPDGKNIATVVYANGAGGVEVWNSELANPSLSTIERIAEQRVTRQLTPAERSTYLAGISG